MNYTPIIPAICCIGYNRPASMRRLLNSIVNAIYDDKTIPLIISIDESDMSDEVEAVANSFKWEYGEKIILRYPQRLGLKEHCMRCSDLSIKYGAAFFLEDDAVVAPGYYRYTKAAVNFYRNDDRVIAISLYAQKWSPAMGCAMIPAHNGYDTFFYQRELSHGLCWIGKGWEQFREWHSTPQGMHPVYNKDVPYNVYGWNPDKSWSYFMSFYMSEKQKYFICPYHSYASNLHEVGEHSAGSTNICQTVVSESTAGKFNFATYPEAIVYDSFFERRDPFVKEIFGILFSDICMDLNSTKYDWSGYKYILTLRDLPYEIIGSFGINMEPIENNIIFGVPGKALKLYKIPEDYQTPDSIEKACKPSFVQKRMDYLLGKYPIQSLAKTVFNRIKKHYLH